MKDEKDLLDDLISDSIFEKHQKEILDMLDMLIDEKRKKHFPT